MRTPSMRSTPYHPRLPSTPALITVTTYVVQKKISGLTQNIITIISFCVCWEQIKENHGTFSHIHVIAHIERNTTNIETLNCTSAWSVAISLEEKKIHFQFQKTQKRNMGRIHIHVYLEVSFSAFHSVSCCFGLILYIQIN